MVRVAPFFWLTV